MPCKIWGWGNGWRTQHFKTPAKCENAARELAENCLSMSRELTERNLEVTQKLVGKDREINMILNRQATLMENMLHWNFPPTFLSLALSCASSGSISGSCSIQAVIRLEKQGPQGPKAQLLLTRHTPQQCPSQIPPTQIRLLLQQHCFQLFRFLKGHQEHPVTNSCNL